MTAAGVLANGSWPQERWPAEAGRRSAGQRELRPRQAKPPTGATIAPLANLMGPVAVRDGPKGLTIEVQTT